MHWLTTVGCSAVLIGLGLWELMIRRDTGASWYLFNKSLAGTAFLLILLSYTFSAMHHLWRPFKTGLALRRPFGLFGFGLAAFHVGLTFFIRDPANPAAYKFPFPAYFLDHWPAILCALLAFGYFIYAFKISIWPYPFLQSSTKSRIWRRRLRFGYIAVLLVLFHAISLKIEGWISWLQSFDPTLPPLSLIVVVISLSLIVFKSVQLISMRRLF